MAGERTPKEGWPREGQESTRLGGDLRNVAAHADIHIFLTASG